MSDQRTSPSPSGIQERALLAIFETKTPNGEHVFTDDEVRHVLPWLILSAGVRPKNLSQSALRLVGEFSYKARLDLTAPAPRLKAEVDAYYRRNPMAPALKMALEQFLKNPPTSEPQKK